MSDNLPPEEDTKIAPLNIYDGSVSDDNSKINNSSYIKTVASGDGSLDVKKQRVLLITKDFMNSKLYKKLSELFSENPLIEIRQVDPDDFKSYGLKKLKEYFFICYDLKDCGYANSPCDAIREYIKDGGKAVITHDHFDVNKALLDLISFKDLDHKVRQTRDVRKAKLKEYKDHPILTTPNKLNENDIFDITKTHTSSCAMFDQESKLETTLLMTLDDEFQEPYLLITTYGKGQTVYWNVGHIPILKENELKLFDNIVNYLLKKP